MNALTARCPAKINLGLKVLGRRSDGFHDLVTVFQAIDLWDTLRLETSERLELTCDDPSIPTGDDNLVLRAARLLRRGGAARFRLHKSIPSGGGLGGGSSNAAAAILLLERAWSLRISELAREAAAARLGSDVVFFLHGGTALGTGRGERIQPLGALEERPLVLGVPPFGLSTAEVFGRLHAPLTPPDAGVTVRRLFGKFAEGNDFGLATNDLESVAFVLRPELVPFRDGLVRSGAQPALLSGSGSSVFGLFRARDAADEAASRLSREFPSWRIVRTRTIAEGVRVEGPEAA